MRKILNFIKRNQITWLPFICSISLYFHITDCSKLPWKKSEQYYHDASIFYFSVFLFFLILTEYLNYKKLLKPKNNKKEK